MAADVVELGVDRRHDEHAVGQFAEEREPRAGKLQLHLGLAGYRARGTRAPGHASLAGSCAEQIVVDRATAPLSAAADREQLALSHARIVARDELAADS